jgi:cytochrome o ubiquinol oxidase operon protein cyoD
MSLIGEGVHNASMDTAPGDEGTGEGSAGHDLTTYIVGLALAVGLTGVSFFIARTTLVWTPSIPVALAVLAVAQMGVHLVFFLHITTGADSLNNTLALAFGLLIVFLVMGGSIWIMGHMNHNMMPVDKMMQMQR